MQVTLIHTSEEERTVNARACPRTLAVMPTLTSRQAAAYICLASDWSLEETGLGSAAEEWGGLPPCAANVFSDERLCQWPPWLFLEVIHEQGKG